MAADELQTDAEFANGLSDDPDELAKREALGARHRRRFGYTAAGAEENDYRLLSDGGHPLRIDGPRKQQNVGASRNAHFRHGVVGGIVKH